MITSFKSLKFVFVQAKFLKTQFVRITHDPNKFNNAIVFPTVRGECATSRICPHVVPTFLQCKIGSGRGGEFSDG